MQPVSVADSREKEKICSVILRSLPDWFGIEEAIVDYSLKVRELPFFAVLIGGAPAGFAALKVHNPYTAEVFVIGVHEAHHRQGLGRELILACQEYCQSLNLEFLTVKTLDQSRASPSYEKTRQFYLALGFRPLEVFPTLWDESNPCLFMAKYLPG